MADTATPQQPFTSLLRAGFSLVVTAPAAGFALVSLSRNGAVFQTTQLINGQVGNFGAYPSDVGYRISVSAGAATSTIQEGMTSAVDQTTQAAVTGAAVTANPGVATIILDGVGTTFALTFPAPTMDGQKFVVKAATAITAFSAVATAPATSIKNVPSSLAAGAAITWQYRAANNSWY
jgi:hypothetical protein